MADEAKPRKHKNGQSEIRLSFEGGLLMIEGDRLEPVVADLRCQMENYQLGGETGFQRRTATVSFCHRLKGGKLTVAAGFYHRICQLLKRAGLSFKSERYPLRGNAVLDDETPAWLRIITGKARCQVLIDKSNELAMVCGGIGRAFPESKVLYIAANASVGRSLEVDLKSEIPGARFVTDLEAKPEAKTSICTFELFGRACNFDVWDVILFSNARTLLQKTATRGLLSADDNRIYAVTTPDFKPNQFEALWAEALAGPVIVRADKEDSESSAFLWLLDSPCDSKRGLEGKRTQVWHNSQRNQEVAQFVLNLPELEAVQRMMSNGEKDAPRIAVLVENREHAEELETFLPKFDVCWSASPPPEVRRKPGGTNTIVTANFAKQIGIAADILVRADGGALTLQPFGGFQRSVDFPQRENDERDQHAVRLVFDLLDRREKDAERRLSEYRRFGWQAYFNDQEQKRVSTPDDSPIVDWLIEIAGLVENEYGEMVVRTSL